MRRPGVVAALGLVAAAAAASAETVTVARDPAAILLRGSGPAGLETIPEP
jgi:hypothetical protein